MNENRTYPKNEGRKTVDIEMKDRAYPRLRRLQTPGGSVESQGGHGYETICL